MSKLHETAMEALRGELTAARNAALSEGLRAMALQARLDELQQQEHVGKVLQFGVVCNADVPPGTKLYAAAGAIEKVTPA